MWPARFAASSRMPAASGAGRRLNQAQGADDAAGGTNEKNERPSFIGAKRWLVCILVWLRRDGLDPLFDAGGEPCEEADGNRGKQKHAPASGVVGFSRALSKPCLWAVTDK